MKKATDIIGKIFGRLTVIKRIYPNLKKGQPRWLCKCDCGGEKVVLGRHLRAGYTKSCGCLKLTIGLANIRSLIAIYKLRAKKRGYNYKLTEEQFKEITQKDCYYCGVKPNNTHKQKGCTGSYVYNGIDRIDNTKGYTIDNVVPCCKTCNRVKNDFFTKDEMLKIVEMFPCKFIRTGS